MTTMKTTKTSLAPPATAKATDIQPGQPAKKSTAVAGQVQSLTRALHLLQRLATSDVGLNLTEISAGVGLAPSTAHRLLNSMRQLDFVEYDEDQALWSVGVTAFSVGSAYLKKRDVVAEARPFMKQLVKETGETSNLALLEGDQHVFVSQVECKAVMRMVARIGSSGAVHAAGVGKALLSALPEDEAMAIIRRTGLPALTVNTMTSPEDFLAELRRVREQGYAVDDEEQVMGLRCVAANIYDENSEAIAAVSISGPTVRVLADQLPHYAAAVMAAAEKITHAIGGRKR